MGLVHPNVASLNKALDKFAQEVGWTMEYTLLREAALMCRDAIVFTPPFEKGGGKGDTKQAELVGRRAVARDINTIFVSKNDKTRIAGAMMLNQLANAAKMRDFGSFQKARKLLLDSNVTSDCLLVNKFVSDGDEVRAYQKAQNFFNKFKPRAANAIVDDLRPIHDRFKRLSRQGKTKIGTGRGDYLGKFLVKSKGEPNAYIKLRQEEVGKLKSGWWNVIEALPKPKKKGVEQEFGRRKVAAYVKKFPGNNIQTFYATPKAASIRFGNLIGNADGVADRNNVLNLVFANAFKRIEEDLKQFSGRDVDKFNSGETR